jgi:formamidopyrimidine-DNA glycosylase
MSDYRNIDGEKGKFQEQHRAYRKTGQKCMKKNCNGTIQRIVVGGRSSHFCSNHQIKEYN